jgi:hypothetical protein
VISPLRQLRTPEERVGMLPNASLPPPSAGRSATEADQLLHAALRDGDESAFGQVLDDHFPGMLRVALGYVRDRATAEEVVQDTWVAAIEGIGGSRDVQPSRRGCFISCATSPGRVVDVTTGSGRSPHWSHQRTGPLESTRCPGSSTAAQPPQDTAEPLSGQAVIPTLRSNCSPPSWERRLKRR